LDVILGGHGARDLFLVVSAAGKIADRAIRGGHGFESCGLDGFTDVLRVCAKILEQNLIGPQVPLQPERIGDLAECSAENQAVKPAQSASDLVGVSCGKLVHAFLSVSKCFWTTHNDTSRSAFFVRR